MEYNRICAISDIHGDAELLLLQLRDNCDLIEKTFHMSDEIDWDFIDNMNMPFLSDTNVDYYIKNDNGIYSAKRGSDKYKNNWNYKWKAKNTLCVICGDILDGYRPGMNYDRFKNKLFGEFPFEELKIICFLREMQKDALLHDSKLVIVYGNHDIHNIYTHFFSVKHQYISNYTLNNRIVHHKYGPENRQNMFKIGSYTYGLLNSLNMSIIYKYKTHLFLHGRLKKIDDEIGKTSINKFIEYTEDIINKEQIFINNNRNDIRRIVFNNNYSLISAENILVTYNNYLNENGITKTLYSLISSLTEPREYSYSPKSEVCDLFIRDLNNFTDEDINEYTIVVGHSINSYFIEEKKETCSFTNIEHSQVNSGKFDTYILSEDYAKSTTNNIISENDCKLFNTINITFDCNISNINYPQLYRVDCGSSRSFIDIGIFNHFKIGKLTMRNMTAIYSSHIYRFLSTIPQALIFNKVFDLNEENNPQYVPKLNKCTIKNLFINRTCYDFTEKQRDDFILLLQKFIQREQTAGSYNNIKAVVQNEDLHIENKKILEENGIKLLPMELYKDDVGEALIYDINDYHIIPYNKTIPISSNNSINSSNLGTYKSKLLYKHKKTNEVYHNIYL